MSTTRWSIGVAAFALLLALGTGWTEHRRAATTAHDGSGVLNAPATLPVGDPPVTDAYQEYDRPDLLLTQG